MEFTISTACGFYKMFSLMSGYNCSINDSNGYSLSVSMTYNENIHILSKLQTYIKQYASG